MGRTGGGGELGAYDEPGDLPVNMHLLELTGFFFGGVVARARARAEAPVADGGLVSELGLFTGGRLEDVRDVDDHGVAPFEPVGEGVETGGVSQSRSGGVRSNGDSGHGK